MFRTMCMLGRAAAIAAAVVGGGAALAADRTITYAIATADLNVGYPFGTLPLALGYFAEEGLDVKVVPGQSTAVTAQLLLTGRADVGVTQPDPVMIQRAKLRVPLISVYPVSRRGTNRIGVVPDSPIQAVADLKGRRVGVSDLGSGGVIYLRARLKEIGLTMNDIELTAVGYGTPQAEALKNGNVAAMVSFNGGFIRQEIAGYRLRYLPDANFDDRVYSYNMFATQKFVDENPDVIAKIGRATARATVFLKTNPEAAVRLFWKQYPDRAPKDPNDAQAFRSDLAILKAQMRDMKADDLPVDFRWGSQEESTFATMQQFLLDGGQIDKAIAPAEFFTAKFVDAYNAFDRAAVVRQAQAMAR